jgi:hypothetical protein
MGSSRQRKIPPKGPATSRVGRGPKLTYLQCGRCKPRLRHKRRCWPQRPLHPHSVYRACQGREHSVGGVDRAQQMQPEDRKDRAGPSTHPPSHKRARPSPHSARPTAISALAKSPQGVPDGPWKKTSASGVGQVAARPSPESSVEERKSGGRGQRPAITHLLSFICVYRGWGSGSWSFTSKLASGSWKEASTRSQ